MGENDMKKVERGGGIMGYWLYSTRSGSDAPAIHRSVVSLVGWGPRRGVGATVVRWEGVGRIVIILHTVIRVLRHDRHGTVEAATTGQAVLDHLRRRVGTTMLVVIEVVRVAGTSSSEVMGRQRRERARVTVVQ